MVAAYEREWATLCALPRERLCGAPVTMPAAEASFYEQSEMEGALCGSMCLGACSHAWPLYFHTRWHGTSGLHCRAQH